MKIVEKVLRNGRLHCTLEEGHWFPTGVTAVGSSEEFTKFSRREILCELMRTTEL